MLPRSALGVGPGVGDAVYCLDHRKETGESESFLYLRRNAIGCNPSDIQSAMEFMEKMVRPERIWGNLVPRKQCMFGPPYKRYQTPDRATWPKLVHKVLAFARALAVELGIPNPEAYNGAHANFYADGASKVAKHADDEPELVKDMPIISISFGAPRDFTIWRTPGASRIEGKGRVADVTLYSGDVAVMMGKMQRDFQHSIEPASGPVGPRLNFTVRQLG